MKKLKSPDEYYDEAIENIRHDRSYATALLVEITRSLLNNSALSKDYGLVAAKYLETLQRSNEQLVKVATALKKSHDGADDEEFSEHDKENIFEELQNEKNKEKKE